jgi:hypothetical protein
MSSSGIVCNNASVNEVCQQIYENEQSKKFPYEKLIFGMTQQSRIGLGEKQSNHKE